MLKKVITVMFLVYISISTTGCDKVEELIQPGPKEVVIEYLKAQNDGRLEESYKYLSAQDKSIQLLDEYKSKGSEAKSNPIAMVLMSDMSFHVLTAEETGNTANVKVEITMPDMRVVFKDFMGMAFSGSLEKATQKEISEMVAKKYENTKLPTMTKNTTFNLLKEKDGWKIFLDFKGIEEQKLKKEEIRSLLDDAKQLRKSKELTGAIQKYEKVLSLDGEVVEAKKAIEETQEEVKSIEVKQEYLKNVELYDFEAKYYNSYLDKDVAGVNFKIKNKGDKTLKKVEVTVYFQDANGNTIAEEDYNPVLVSSYNYMGDNKPLKPNYIWQMEKDKFYQAKSVPNEWKEGSATAKITDIEFEE